MHCHHWYKQHVAKKHLLNLLLKRIHSLLLIECFLQIQALSFKVWHMQVCTLLHRHTHIFTIYILVVRQAPRSFSFHVFFIRSLSVSASFTLLYFPRLPLRSIHFITLMNQVGFSRRGRPPIMQRQMPPVPISHFLCLRWCRETGWLKEG